MSFIAPLQASNRIIELYSESQNFAQANSFASTVIRYVGDYSKEQIQKIISAGGENDQIKYSVEIWSVINALKKNKNVTDEEVDGWLIEAGLEKLVKVKDEEPEADG